jgi:cytoskeleton protein RodZ
MASFGENLRRERELRGIELAKIADATKICVRFLKAIEEDRWEVLPGGMFPRAFVRQYAGFLGLDVERTVAEFVRVRGAAWSAPPSPPQHARQKRRSREGWGATVFLVAVGLLGLGLMLIGRAPARRRAASATPSAAVTVRPSATPIAAPAPPASLMLELKAQQPCWVAARVDGESVMDRVLIAGESTTMQAAGEILLSVGNAGGLAVSVNGQPALPLGREGEVRRNIRIARDSLSALVEASVTVASSRSN